MCYRDSLHVRVEPQRLLLRWRLGNSIAWLAVTSLASRMVDSVTAENRVDW